MSGGRRVCKDISSDEMKSEKEIVGEDGTEKETEGASRELGQRQRWSLSGLLSLFLVMGRYAKAHKLVSSCQAF